MAARSGGRRHIRCKFTLQESVIEKPLLYRLREDSVNRVHVRSVERLTVVVRFCTRLNVELKHRPPAMRFVIVRWSILAEARPLIGMVRGVSYGLITLHRPKARVGE